MQVPSVCTHHHRSRPSRRHGTLSRGSRPVVPPAQLFLPVVARKCRTTTCFARPRNTIRVPAQPSHPRHRIVWQAVGDSGCTLGASGRRIGSYGCAPSRTRLAHMVEQRSGRRRRVCDLGSPPTRKLVLPPTPFPIVPFSGSLSVLAAHAPQNELVRRVSIRLVAKQGDHRVCVKLARMLAYMTKTQVYFPDEDLEALRSIGRRTGRSVADLVREAVRRVWLRPDSSGPVALWDGTPTRASVEHDPI